MSYDSSFGYNSKVISYNLLYLIFAFLVIS